MKLTIGLLSYQMEFLRSRCKFAWLCAGLGAGKSYTLAHYCIGRMLENPETLGLICAATYAQLRDSILAELFRQLTSMGLAYDYSIQTGYITLKCNGARVKTFSLDNYEVLRGIEVGWIAIDEACLAKEAAYNVAIGRLRCKHSHRLECRIVSTPRGFDYLYDRYVGELRNGEHELIHATAYMNHFLPAGYVESLRSLYSPKMFRQEVLAEFVSNAEGVIYHAFDRTEHCRKVDLIPGYPIWVGMDFNVNPMTAVLANVTGGTVRVFDEIYLKNSNTFAMAEEIKKRYPHTQVNVTPDATGGSRKTSSSKSDHTILRDAGFKVIVGRSNPKVEDRYNTVNARMREARIEIDTDRCPMLVRDLERVNHEANADYLTHISDAFGYLLWQVMPLKPVRPTPQMHQR